MRLWTASTRLPTTFLWSCTAAPASPDEMIQKAISLGVSKININTECQLVFAEATRKYIEAGKDQQGKGFDPPQAAGSRRSGHR